MLRKPFFIDFEASSLNPNSYPIEVGWSDDQGNVESHLINPIHVDDWDDWDFHAQHEIHGISRTILCDVGKSPVQVATRLNEVLDGKEVYCDGLPYDRLWMECLFEYAGIEPLFGLQHINILMREMLSGNQMIPASWSNGQLEKMMTEARNNVSGPRHRAGNDALYLCELYRLANRAVGMPV
jgi:hypothetical protein